MLLGASLHLEISEWLALIEASVLLVFAELMNTSIERLTDFIVDKRKISIAKQAKDIAAGAVLITAIHFVVTAVLVLYPKLSV